MARAILAMQYRGTGSSKCAVYRLTNGNPVQIGYNFATHRISGVTGSGFTAGDTVSLTGGHTATVTKVDSTYLVLSNLSLGWAGAGGTITVTAGVNVGTTATAGVFEGPEGTSQNGFGSGGGTEYGRRWTHGRVVKFKHRLYCINWQSVYRLDESTGHWEEVCRLTGVTLAGDAAYSKTGLMIVKINNVPTLCYLLSAASSGNGYRFRSTDGTNWSQLFVNTPMVIERWHLFKETVYCRTGGSGHFSYNFELDTFATITSDLRAAGHASLITWKGSLYLLGYVTATGFWKLERFTQGNYVTVQTFSTDSLTAYDYHKSCMFIGPDGDLYCLFYGQNGAATSRGWYCFRVQFSGSYSATNLTATVLPSYLRYGTQAVDTVYPRFERFIDNETNAVAGGPVKPLLFYSPNDFDSTARTLFEFVNSSTELTELAVDVGHHLYDTPDVSSGGGERTFISGGIDILITNTANVGSGDLRIYFQLFQKPGTSNVGSLKFKLQYNSQLHPPVTLGTLTNPTVGTITGGNTLNGLTANNGATTYEVTWQATSSDSQIAGNFENVCPVVHS